jgi:ppGpp synthetase/RelA/SpoT-type nucleotidyltranferase
VVVDTRAGNAAKPTIKAYPVWLSRLPGAGRSSLEKNRYEQVAAKALVDISESAFWTGLQQALDEFDDDYLARTSYRLFAGSEGKPDRPVRKTWESFLSKTYRKNVLNNVNWPDEPVGGWLTGTSWFTQINDIVRTAYVVKYLDGVEFLVEKLERVAHDLGLTTRCDFEAKDEGYYAAHLYVSIEVDVPTPKWDTEKVPIQFEIQVTTQLQEVIRRLTHEHYADRRLDEPASIAWQWQYRNPNFVPNYLGHILHYLEGMIMEVRDKSESRSHD